MINLIHCKDLPALDILDGLSDPFVKITLKVGDKN